MFFQRPRHTQVNLQPALAGTTNHPQEGIGSIFGQRFSFTLSSSDKLSFRTFTLGSPSIAKIRPLSVSLQPFSIIAFSLMPRALATRPACKRAFLTADMGIQTAGRRGDCVGGHWTRQVVDCFPRDTTRPVPLLNRSTFLEVGPRLLPPELVASYPTSPAAEGRG